MTSLKEEFAEILQNVNEQQTRVIKYIEDTMQTMRELRDNIGVLQGRVSELEHRIGRKHE